MILKLADCDGMTVEKVLCALRRESRRVGAIRLEELVLEKGEPRRATNGVYFFFDGERLVYVGKASSRSLVERIPAHLDARIGAWFSNLMKKLAVKRARGEPSDQDMRDALRELLNFEIAMLTSPSRTQSEKAKIAEVESAFQWAHGLGRFKKRNVDDLTVTLAQLRRAYRDRKKR